MKKLCIHFVDTDEIITLEKDTEIVTWGNHEESNLSTILHFEVNDELLDILRKTPIMFYIYEDKSILKLYRSVYIEKMEWID